MNVMRMLRAVIGGVGIVMFINPLLFGQIAESKSKPAKKDESREVFGFKYDLPPDYPIEKINGVVQPIQLTDYVYMKLEEMNRRIEELASRITVLEGTEAKPSVPDRRATPNRFLSIEQKISPEVSETENSESEGENN